MREIRPGVIAVHWVNDIGATKSKIPACETPGTASGRQGHGNGRKATHHLRRPGGGRLRTAATSASSTTPTPTHAGRPHDQHP